MRHAEDDIGRLSRFRPMIEPARLFVQFLVKASAIGHVQLLKAAADGEQRHARLDRGGYQGEIDCVAPLIVHHAGIAFDPAIALRGDVGLAARQQQAVQERERRQAIASRAQGRKDDWDGAKSGDRLNIGVIDDMRAGSCEDPEIGGYADNRRGRGHEEAGCTPSGATASLRSQAKACVTMASRS
jgi:hypothetical protein